MEKKKVKTTVEYFDQECGEDKIFTAETDLVSVIGITRVEEGAKNTCATLGIGNPVHVACAAAHMMAELVLQTKDPHIKLLSVAAYIKTFDDLIKEGDPTLGMLIPAATELFNDDEEDDAEESDGEE